MRKASIDSVRYVFEQLLAGAAMGREQVILAHASAQQPPPTQHKNRKERERAPLRRQQYGIEEIKSSETLPRLLWVLS
jgi:hypothetical protein